MKVGGLQCSGVFVVCSWLVVVLVGDTYIHIYTHINIDIHTLIHIHTLKCSLLYVQLGK